MKQQTSTSRKVAGYYLRHISKYPRLRNGILLMLPVTVAVNTYLPSLIAADVLSRLGSGDYQNSVWQSFGPELVAYFVIAFIGIATWRIIDAMVWRLEGSVTRDVAQEVFGHLTNESADFHANNFSGSLVSHTNKVLGGYVRLADTTIFMVLPMIIGLVMATTILLFKAPVFALILASFAAMFILIAFKLSKRTQQLGAAHAAHESEQTGLLADAIGNIMAIKSFARKDYENQRFASGTDRTYDSLQRLAQAHRRQMNSMNFMTKPITGVSLAVGVIAVLKFKADLGTVFLILNYAATTVDQLFSFGNSSLRNYNRAIGDSVEMVNILSRTPEIVDPAQPEPARMTQGSIAFNSVTFAHVDADDAIFEGLDLDIKHGEKIGLVGHSGSGKSTFVRLLLRFSDIDGGEILVDGQDISKVRQDDLHNVIAYVPQEPLLFHRTIAENIGYGKVNATEDEVRRAAIQANAAEFIDTIPTGYDTVVGERGIKLSGGQRQRIALARAMLKNAPILVLDEATSALDSESEVLIQEALWKLMEGRTAIIIAHRLSTIQKMDRIIVMDDGSIVEQGSHRQLLKKRGIYAKLWAHQSGGFMED